MTARLLSLLVSSICFGLAAWAAQSDVLLVEQLLSTESLAYDHVLDVVGNFTHGQIAFTGSDSGLAVAGGNGIFLFSEHNASQSAEQISFNGDGLFTSDLASGQLVSFLGTDLQPLTSAGYLAALTLFNVSNTTTSTTIMLTEPVFIGLSSAVFAGQGRVVVYDGAAAQAWEVSLTTGDVSELSNPVDHWSTSSGWVSIGVAGEFTFQDTYLVYADPLGRVEQQSLADTSTGTLYSGELAIASVAVSPRTSRWAYVAQGMTVGTADALLVNALPSSQPSTQPTSMPSLHPDAPKVISLSAIPSASSMLLSVGLDSNALFAGNVYCAAFPTGTGIASTNQLIAVGKSVAYAPQTRTVSVIIDGLVSQSAYDLYCYVITQQGYANTLTDLINTKTTVSTICCKLITYTSNPTAIYSDFSKYASQPAAVYTFSFQLNAAPKARLVVTPCITTNGVVASNVVASPSSFAFSSSSTGTSLKGSFVLISNSNTVTGLFNFNLTLSNSSFSEYTAPSLVVQMLSTFEPPPAPALKAACFSNAGSSLLVMFDSPTNLAGGAYNSWLCGNMFAFIGSNHTDCAWLNSTHVEGIFRSSAGNNASLPTIGDTFTLLPNQTKALCQSSDPAECNLYQYSLAQEVSIAGPSMPLVPNVVLQMPSAVGGCDNLTITASLSTGSAGRNWVSAIWSVSSIGNAANTIQLQSYLASIGTSIRQIVVPRSMLQSVSYTITLTLTNFFGRSASATSIVTVSANVDLPVLSISGSTSLSFTASQTVAIYSRAFFSSCSGSSDALVYTWQVATGGRSVSAVSTSKDRTVFSLSPFSLSAGQVYVITVNCSVIKSTGSSSSASVTASAIVSITRGKGGRRGRWWEHAPACTGSQCHAGCHWFI